MIQEKRRVTDLSECSRITLPRPLKAEEEAKLELRKKTQIKIFRDYIHKNTGKNGSQRTILTEDEHKGLLSLQKRIAKGNIIVLKTDKSSKLAVTNEAEYKKMGEEHTKNDKVINRQEVIEMEEELNGHNRAWANIWNSGKDHGHFERIITSKTTHSENVADLYLMVKDHKEGNKTRPTATGCTSNTQGLSNAVAELLEAVSNAEKQRYNCISSEDMLARIHRCNEFILHKNKIRSYAILRRLQCNYCKVMKMVDCPNTESHDWDTIKNQPLASQGVPEPWEPNIEQLDDLNKMPMASQGVHEPWDSHNSQDKSDQALKITELECCGQDIRSMLARTCPECGPAIQEQEKLCLVGSDVKALFPSIKSEKTGQIIREAIQKTSITFDGFNQEKALAYICMNQELTTNIEEIAHLLPTRTSGRDSKLKMSAIKPNWDPQEKFSFKNIEISEQENKQLVARVAEIATRALFQNHAYRFGGDIYHQLEGGSIGDRWTGAASEIVMQNWATEYKQILENSGAEVLLLAGYVDDGRQLTTSLPMGSRYNPEMKKFETSQEAENEDNKNKKNGESDNQRMARTCLTAMNSINCNLEFTTETPEEFENEQLPTLDFKLWQEQDNTINHSYFQKPVKTPYVIMSRSGMALQQKVQILANELTRRISNINQKNNKIIEYIKVIEQYTRELKNSEYNHNTAREIILSGIRGLRTRKHLRKIKKQEFYRPAHKTAHLRAKKKLVSRESWYKNKKDAAQLQLGQDCSTRSPRQGLTRSLNPKTDKNRPRQESESKIKAVMFVPYTPGSILAKKLRENEENLAKITQTKVKIVERTGTQLQHLLTRSNPWKGIDCTRKNCLLCFTKNKTEKNMRQDCHQRNIVYETRCMTCQEQETERIQEQEISDNDKKEEITRIKLFKYIGETSRSSYERGWEHLNDLTQLKSSSHMLKHIVLNHPDQELDKIMFGMRILRTCKSSFERQIHESVLIQQEREQHNILNSRSEYNRCSLPRISTQLGESEYKIYNDELAAEKEQEEHIEAKIRQLRKLRNKSRLVPLKREQEHTKRRKLNENNDYVIIQEVWGRPETAEPETRKSDEHQSEPKNKKIKTQENEQTQT